MKFHICGEVKTPWYFLKNYSMISTDALQVGFLSLLTIVNEGLSLTIVNEESSLKIVIEGSSLTKRWIFLKNYRFKNDHFLKKNFKKTIVFKNDRF